MPEMPSTPLSAAGANLEPGKFAALQNIGTALQNMTKLLSQSFPQAGPVSNQAGVQSGLFLAITTSSGGTYKVPLYLP